MPLTKEDLNNVIQGACLGLTMSGVGGGLGGLFSKSITGFSDNFLRMGLSGGLVTYPLVYGILGGVLGKEYITFSPQNWLVSGFIGASLTTVPVNFLGTLIGYGLLGTSGTFTQVASNAAISSTLIPLAAAALVGGGFPAYNAYSQWRQHVKIQEAALERRGAPADADLVQQSRLLEEGDLNHRPKAPGTPQSSAPQLGLFSPRANQGNPATQTATIAPSI